VDVRIDLAAAHRLALRLGLNEGIANHFSARLESNPNRFLVTPSGLHWSEIRASNLLVTDGEGRVLEGNGEVEASAFCIHSHILQARSDAACVLHTHQPYATTIAVLKGGRLLPVSQSSLRFHSRIAYEDTYKGAADQAAEGARLAQAMGDKAVLFHAHHGVIVAAESLARAFDDLYYLERASQLQLLAESTGGKLRFIPDDIAEQYAGRERPNNTRKQAVRHFAALKRILDREEPDYAD
jgi:ribulose-5-phosphate 4-epimerase/fuculose-1-phosphate aldolase